MDEHDNVSSKPSLQNITTAKFIKDKLQLGLLNSDWDINYYPQGKNHPRKRPWFLKRRKSIDGKIRNTDVKQLISESHHSVTGNNV